MNDSNSFGFEVIDFARDVLNHPLDLWQEFCVIHGGELLPDGRPRFRKVFILVSRQNGKTEIPVVLSLWWQWICELPMILGTSTKLDYARESWMKAIRVAEQAPGLPVSRNDRKKWTRSVNGEQESWHITEAGADCRYKIAASNAEGGRSLTVHRLVLDELRQHKTYEAWGASVPAGNAVDDFQVWAMSNAGDHTSVVLLDEREAALKFIDKGEGDYRSGIFEWSAPDGAAPNDIHALAQANPNLGHRIHPDSLLGDAESAISKGGAALATFRIENMCQWVAKVDTALSLEGWQAGFIPETMDQYRDQLAAVLDIDPSGSHCTLLVAAQTPTGVRVEVVKAWEGPEATSQVRTELPALLAKIKPVVFGWLPGGPAAALAANLRARRRQVWPPPGVKVEEIKADVAAACMGLGDLVRVGEILHSGDPLLNSQVEHAAKLWVGDRWVFSRKNQGTVDAVYAMAGAVHLIRSRPTAVGKPRIVRSRRA